MIGRALVLVAGVALAGCSASAAPSSPRTTHGSSSASAPAVDLRREFATVERRYGVRLGVAALDTGTGRSITYRAGERFAFASTNKTFIAAATLCAGTDLDSVIRYGRSDLVANSPVTQRHTSLSVRALIDAMLRYSDNTAANLLVRRLGGPARVQAFLRAAGDGVTHVDRLEPELNTAVPGDVRDTTTPTAFARDLQRVLLGSVLTPSARTLLEDTMRRNTTGDDTIRAGVPAGSVVADKTGTASYGTRNDIAVVRIPHRAPLVLVLFTTRATRDAATQDAALAAATRIVVRG